MKFKLGFERLEQRENPDAGTGEVAIPPVDPIPVPPAPIVDPGTSPGNQGNPPADPVPPR